MDEADDEVGGEQAIASYTSFELSVLHHAISAADSKASFVLGIAVAFAAATVQPTVRALQAHAEVRAITGLIGDLSLILSGLAAFLTVAPRIMNTTSTSEIFWSSSVFLGSVDDYVRHIRQRPNARLGAATLGHLYLTAHVARRKYARLRIAFYAAPLGIALLAVSYLAGPAR